MLVGDKKKFAIEWQERCKVNGQRHVHFRFWSQDTPIGDFEDDVMETIVKGYIKDFLQHRKVREEHIVPVNLDPKTIYNSLYESFYSSEVGANGAIMDHSLDLRSIFHLTDIGGTGFDKVGIMACSILGGQLLIWKEHHGKEVRHTFLEPGYLENVFECFMSLLDE